MRTPAGEHGEPAIGVVVRRRDDALRDLLLEHQRERRPVGWPGLDRQPAHEKFGADIVGQIGDDPDVLMASGERGEVGRQCIARDDGEPAGIVCGDFLQRGKAALVALDRDDMLCAIEKQRACQAAGTGADLDDGRAGQVAGSARHLGGDVEVEQEVLAERLLGAQFVPCDHVAQRRQSVDAHVRRLIRSAMSIAASRLSGRAMPLPAMSNAVPWSGEVRTKGRPSVTLTVSSKASALAGISAWS